MKFYYVYILKCSDDSYYTGMTSDIDKRLSQHNSGNTYDNYTLKRRPVNLVWLLHCNDPYDAIRIERQIKKWTRKKKEALIAEEWDLLSEYSRNYTEHGKPIYKKRCDRPVLSLTKGSGRQ